MATKTIREGEKVYLEHGDILKVMVKVPKKMKLNNKVSLIERQPDVPKSEVAE